MLAGSTSTRTLPRAQLSELVMWLLGFNQASLFNGVVVRTLQAPCLLFFGSCSTSISLDAQELPAIIHSAGARFCPACNHLRSHSEIVNDGGVGLIRAIGYIQHIHGSITFHRRSANPGQSFASPSSSLSRTALRLCFHITPKFGCSSVSCHLLSVPVALL